jgi:hypothetical protein
MTDIDRIRDLRFEGMDIPQLQEWIGKIKQGRGSESMHNAVAALDKCVQVVVDLDERLRNELGKLGIDWQGNAGALAHEAGRQRSVVLAEAPEALKTSAAGVDDQGSSFESARNTLPNTDELQHKQSENFFEWVGGAFGYESDYDKEVKQIQAQRQAAQAALAGYRDSTVSNAQRFQPLPEMPAATVAAQAPSAPSVGGGMAGSSFSTPGTPGGEAVPGGHAAPGGGYGTPGSAGSTAGGGRSGAAEMPRQPDLAGAANPRLKEDGGYRLSTASAVGAGVGGAALAGSGAAAASKLLGGAGKAGGTGAGGRAGASGGGSSPGRGGSSGVGGGPGDTTAGRPAGNTPGSRPAAGSLMGPAATRDRKADPDAEHQNDYVIEETPFDDERLVAPPVLGDDVPAQPDDDETELRKQD